ncbi:MAG: GNAT family N-acetyltransferase [Bacteroidota bacterium]
MAATIKVLKAALKSDADLAKAMGVSINPEWTAFGRAAIGHTLQKLEGRPPEEYWWLHFVIHKATNQLIGSCGYKGPPCEKGIVEIGYEIAPDFRRRGLATELAIGLVGHAFAHPKVRQIIAHTLSHNNASTKVLQKAGLQKVAELFHNDDGQVWKWSVCREE